MEATQKPQSPSPRTALTFPFRQLPYELQLMIVRESVVSSTPIEVGWLPDAPESQIILGNPGSHDGRATGAILHTCRDFAQDDDLHRCYYENNVFELVELRGLTIFL